MSLAFLYSKVEVHWGFIVRQLGASAAQLAYVLPPPPTVVGAFMNPLARILGLGESLNPKLGPAGGEAMRCALDATLAAAAGLAGSVGVAVYAEPSRITATLYKTGGDYSRALREPPYLAADRLLPVQAVGAASAPGALLALAWLLDWERLSDCLGAILGLGDLSRAAWSIYRVGSREGVASTREAGVFDKAQLDIVSGGGVFESQLYQPAECVSPLQPLPRITLYDTNYREAAYYTPSGPGGPAALAPPGGPSRFMVRSGCAAARPRGAPELAVAFQTII